MSLGRGIVLGTMIVFLVVVIAGVVTLDFYLRQSNAMPEILRPTVAAVTTPTPRPILEPPPTPTFIVVPIELPPSTVTAPPTPTRADEPRARGERDVYIVQAGDTLSGIAAQFEISVEALIAENGITDPSLIQVGQELLIPAE